MCLSTCSYCDIDVVFVMACRDHYSVTRYPRTSVGCPAGGVEGIFCLSQTVAQC